MAILTSSFCSDFGILAFLIFSGVYLFLRQRCNKFWKKLNISHTKARLPFGDIGTSFLSGRIHLSLTAIYNSFKEEKVVGIWSTITPILLIRDLDLLKNIFVTDFMSFPSRQPYINEKDDPLTGNLYFIGGEKWSYLRAKLAPVFNPNRIKMVFPIWVECSDVLVDVLNKFAMQREIVEMKDYLNRFTIDVFSSCTFGIEVDSLKNPEADFRKMVKKVTEPSFLNGLRYMIFFYPKLAEFLKFKLTDPAITKFFLDIVRETIGYRKANNIKKNDFMQLLIQLMDEGKIEDVDEIEGTGGSEEKFVRKFTFEEVAAQACAFFIGGFETSSSAMQFALYELALNPDLQEKVRAEIKSVSAKYSDKITFEGIQEMEFLGRVIDETLRKYPGPFLGRRCFNDFKINGTDIVIPKGTRVMIPVYCIHHDPVHYPNPEVFDPDRFTEEAKSKRHQCAYIPFGSGPRTCIGMRFGLMQTRFGLAKLLSSYKFEICEKTPVPMPLVKKGLVSSPGKELYLRISKLI